jgi:plastocyanin
MKALFLAAFGLVLAIGPAAADAVVTQKSRAFRPTDVTVNRGEAVTFTNDDGYIHQIYVDGLFDSDERSPGENLTENFTQSGTFEVHCHIHPKMKLIVHVK